MLRKKSQPVHPAGGAADGLSDMRSVGEAILSITQKLEDVADGGRLLSHKFDNLEYKALEEKFDGLRGALRNAERGWAMSKGEIQTRRMCIKADGLEVLAEQKDALYLAGEMAVAAQKVVTTKASEAADAKKQSEATRQTVERLRTGLLPVGCSVCLSVHVRIDEQRSLLMTSTTKQRMGGVRFRHQCLRSHFIDCSKLDGGLELGGDTCPPPWLEYFYDV